MRLHTVFPQHSRTNLNPPTAVNFPEEIPALSQNLSDPPHRALFDVNGTPRHAVENSSKSVAARATVRAHPCISVALTYWSLAEDRTVWPGGRSRQLDYISVAGRRA